MEFEEEVKKYFKDLLKCPICFETLDSVPIYQCQNGHVVCKKCHPKLKMCSICRVDVIEKAKRDGPIRNLKLEEMVERLQSSVSEATKKLVSENIQIDPIVPKTPNVPRDNTQVVRRDTVQLNIVEDDENLTREPRCEPCCDLFFGLTKIMLGVILCLVLVSMVGGVFFGIGYLFYLGTTPSVIVGLFLVWAIVKMYCHFCY